MPGSREEDFKEIQQFYTFYTQITSPLGGGNEFTIACHLTLQMLYIRQSIAIGHLSDSGDLKSFVFRENEPHIFQMFSLISCTCGPDFKLNWQSYDSVADDVLRERAILCA